MNHQQAAVSSMDAPQRWWQRLKLKVLHGRFLPRVLSIVVLVVAWHLSVVIWQPQLLPYPLEVMQTFWQELGSGELPYHLGITLQRVAIAFSLALTLGLALGLAMGHFRQLDLWLDATLTLLLNIPALVTIVLCLMWLGLNEVAAVTAVVINKLPNMAIVFREGAKTVDRDLLEVAKVYRLPWWRTVRRIYLPQLYPFFLAATRTGLALVWKIVLVVELLGCSDGVGFKISVFFQLFDIVSILAYTFAFVVVIFLVEGAVLRPWEKHMQRWQKGGIE